MRRDFAHETDAGHSAVAETKGMQYFVRAEVSDGAEFFRIDDRETMIGSRGGTNNARAGSGPPVDGDHGDIHAARLEIRL